jgi:hypothetical protein
MWYVCVVVTRTLPDFSVPCDIVALGTGSDPPTTTTTTPTHHPTPTPRRDLEAGRMLLCHRDAREKAGQRA